MDEPSVLDYLKSRLNIRTLLLKTGAMGGEGKPERLEQEDDPSPRSFSLAASPWRSLLALLLAFIAQRQFEPPAENAKLGIVLYFVSACVFAYALIQKELQVSQKKPHEGNSVDLSVRRIPLYFFIPLLLISFFAFSGNRFTALNVTLWIATLISGLMTFWVPEKKKDWRLTLQQGIRFFKNPQFVFRIDYWKVLVLVVFLISAWFHLNQLNTIPYNMTSDHTEKLLDIQSVLNGEYSIFFPNNAGREPIHFYLAAFFIKVFNTGLTFFTLKITMALAFLLGLIYVYKLGNEIGTSWTGLFAMILMGFASWTNMIARVGLRLILAPVFVAPVLFYFLRGIRQSRRNDFILAGILLGLGLLGYSAFRIVPVVVVAGVILYLLYRKFDRKSQSVWWACGLLIVFSLVLSLPLFRFSIENPELVGFRTLTRMTSAERQLPGEVVKIFLNNFWKAITMPFWKDGSTWVISIPDRPALDLYSAVLYFLGLLVVVYRWVRSRSWQDLFLLVSIPLLMLPSILSLAFPDENPSLSRAGGASVPIFILCGIGLETLVVSLWSRTSRVFSKLLLVLLGVGMLFFSAVQNFNIAFRQYPAQYANATWNTTQMGEVAKSFIETTGYPDNVWVVGVPYWVDTRLVAINAGYIGRDYAVWPQDIETTLEKPGPKLFLLKFDDLLGMERIKQVYPEGFSIYHQNVVAGRDFIAYFVPPHP
ncbi:MAG: glycosyltransferase family 39 protein [Chloroflexi bacterium]|nr:glycosyltransferase family 39 protein [Chloroflexota bacterium]